MNLSRLPSGKWRVSVKHQGRRATATARTRAEATQLGAELLLEMGASPKLTGATVEELLAAWLAAAELSIGYRADAIRIIDRLPATFTGRRIADVTPSVIEGLYRQLARDGWTVNRIARAHAVCSSAYTLARRWEWTRDNPFTAVRKPVPARPAIRPPTPADVDRLLAGADPRFRLYLLASAALGARRGEMVALQWADVTDRAVTIRRALSYAPGQGVQAGSGKTGTAGHRVVAIDAELAAELKAHRVEQVARALEHGLPAPVWVFSHNAGVDPWRPDFASAEFRRLRKKLGLDHVRLHDLRHYVATQLLGAGIPLKTVSTRLGHRQMATTSDTYAAYVPAADQAAAEIMAGLRTAK